MKNATVEYLSIEDEVGEQKSYSALLLEGAPTIAPLIRAASANARHTSIELTTLDLISSTQELPCLDQYDLILLDVSRADKQVFEILQKLALLAPDKPVIGIIDGRDERMGAQVLQAGAEDYILKQELTQAVLLHSIRNAIEHKKIKAIRISQGAEYCGLADIQALAKIPEENPNPVLRISKDGQLLYANDSSAPILNAWKCKVGESIPDHWKAKIAEIYAIGSKKEEIIKFAGHVFSLILAPIVEVGYLNIYGLDVTQRLQGKKNLARIARINERMRSLLLNLGSLSNFDDMMAPLLDTAIEITGMDGGGIYLIEDQAALLHLHKGLPDDFVKAVANMPVSAPPVNLAIKSDKPLNICEISEDIKNLIYENGIKHAYVVPLRMGNNIFGFLNLASRKEQPPDEIALHSLWMLALEAGSFFKRAQAEKELRKSAEKYRLLFNNANEAIFVAQDGKIKFSNPKLREITGITQPNLSFLPITKFIHHHDFTVIFDQYDKILNKEAGSSIFELKIVDQEGEIKWLEIHAIKINWDDKPAVLNFASEITERKYAEEALRASEERFRLAAHSASDLIYEWDILSNSLEWFGNIDKILGYAPNEFPRTLEAWAKIIHPDDYDRVIDSIGSSLREKSSFSEEYRIRCKDGSYRHWIDIGTPPSVNSDNLFKWVRVISDITDRKKAEESLREISSRNEALLESVPDIIMEVDNNRVYTWANKEGYEFFGGDVIGENADYYFEGEQRTLEIISPLFDGSDDIVCLESWQRRRDGEKRLLSWKCKALKDANGHVSGALSSARDITERKQMEEALRESREVLHAILNNIPVRVFWKDRNLKYLGCNKPFAQDAGFERPEDLVGKDDHAMGWCEQAELYQADDRMVIESGTAKLNIEEPQTTPSGDEIHLLTSKLPLRDANGAIVGVLGTYQDITDRKRMECKLEDEAIRKRILIEQSRDGIVILDDEGKVFEANKRYSEMLGYSPEEALQLHVWDWDTQWTPEQLLEMINEVDDAGDHFETRHRRKDGTLIDVEISSNGAICGGRKLIFCVCRDITERKRTEEALMDSEAKYRTVIENMQDAFYRIDLDGKLVMLSPSGARHLGYESTDQLMGVNVAQELYANPEDRVRFLNELQAKGSIRDYEIRLKRADGSIFFCSASSQFYRDANGKVLGIEGILRDINERKLAEQNLRASEERYKLVVENANDAIFIVQDMNIRFTNSRLPEILGYPTDSIIGRPFANFIHPDDRDLVVARHKARLAGEKVESNYVFRVISSNGSIKWLEINAVKIAWDGQLATLNFGKDITEQKKASENLEESERKFRTIFEHSSEAAFLVADRILDCNHMACELLGYERDEIIGCFPPDFSPEFQPDGRKSIAAAMEYNDAVVAGTPQNFYWQHKRKNGTLVDTEVSLTSVTIDGTLMVHAVTRDIGQRKRAEETLRRLATVIEQSADGVVILDTDGLIEYVNPAYERITGKTRDEVIGTIFGFFEKTVKNANIHDEVMGSLIGGHTWSGTLQSIKKDGKPFNENITISPVFDTLGAVINYVAIKRDITRQVALEQQVLQSQKMEAIGQLAGGVAHDFNNLLTAILGYSEILRNNLEGQDRLKRDVDEITKASNRAAGLTRQLLAFSRRQIIQPKVLDLNSIVNELNKMLRRLIGENVELATEIDNNLWQIKADPGQIEQIIMNLAVNARDAIPGGGNLTIKTTNVSYDDLSEATRIKLTPRDYVLLAITDTGSGIPNEIIPHIFEPFFTTKEQGKGTGLGLATVYGIVEQNGGAIEVDSKIGSGTTFRIYWPRIADIASKTGKFDIQTESIGGNDTILIVEDEEIVRDLTCRLLGGLGYRTLIASDPREAIELCKVYKNDISLLLTDVVMPKMNGEELARAAKIIIPELSVLFMSGYTDNSFIKHEALESQGDFLPKPFSKELLAGKIREIIERDTARKACRAVASL
jgi:two-component system cell cycle sensor histidine kinase/response regulator CckA